MTPITIIHISDLHLSEELTNDSGLELPHRFGHNIPSFLALDGFLKSEQWDVLVISGDISRVGSPNSFIWARNWLESKLRIGNIELGLDALGDANRERRHVVIVPGNHDRFNGNMTQSSLDNYYDQFSPLIKAGTSTKFEIRGQTINFHLYDSSAENGTFAEGEIDSTCLNPKQFKPSELNVAVLHHHFIQPPSHERETKTEIINSSKVAEHFVGNRFDAVLFGHTHKSYIAYLSREILLGALSDKRKRRGLLRGIVRLLTRRNSDECLVSYKREATQSGRYPLLAYFLAYLYLRNRGQEVRGPVEFRSPREFHAYLDGFSGKDDLKGELERLMKDRMLISMAPSACQDEAKWKGLHKIQLARDANGGLHAEWDRYEFNGAHFTPVRRLQFPA